MSRGVENGSLELKIIVRYEGLKATQYFSKFTPKSDTVFREDLLALKLPHPRRENTTFISHGCVECVWPLIPKNGLLHKQVLTKTSPRTPPERKAFAILLGELSILNIAVKEIYPDNTVKGRKNLKRLNPFTSEGAEERSSSRLISSERNGHHVSRSITGTRPLPNDHVEPRVAEAEAFLQDMSESFRPHKMLKIEPVDVPLPPRTPRAPRSVQTLRLPRSSSSLSSQLSSASKATNPPESASSSSSIVSQKPPLAKVVPPAHNNLNHMFPLFSKPLPATKSLPATTPISEAKMTMPTTLSDLPTPIQEMLRELQPLLSTPQSLPKPVQRQSLVPVPKTTPIPALPKSSEVTTTSTISRPDVSDMPRIQRLSRESCDIRRQINADSIRYASIISELKQLNAAYIPDPLKVGFPDPTMEGRMRKLEQDLDTERRMRLEAEDVARDIRRECKAPFIVPGLLDAFIKLSKLTTQATRMNGTVAKDNG